jgi:hypothetical protein
MDDPVAVVKEKAADVGQVVREVQDTAARVGKTGLKKAKDQQQSKRAVALSVILALVVVSAVLRALRR